MIEDDHGRILKTWQQTESQGGLKNYEKLYFISYRFNTSEYHSDHCVFLVNTENTIGKKKNI